MKDYAVVLLNGSIYKASNFGGIDKLGYTKTGMVSSFTYKKIDYYAIFKFSTNNFINYVEKVKFNALIEQEKRKKLDKYTGVDRKLWSDSIGSSLDITFKFNSHPELIKANYGDDIFGVLREEDGRCYNEYTWKYSNPYLGPVNASLVDPSKESYFCEDYSSSPHANIFYNQFKDYKFYDLGTNSSKTDARLVADVASLMMKTKAQMLQAFNKFVEYGIDSGKIGEFTFFKNNDGSYSRQELLDYKNGLERWLQIYADYQNKIKVASDVEQLYIMYDMLYRYNMLEQVDVNKKILMLKCLCEGSLTDWYFSNVRNGFQHHESLAVKIIKSIIPEQVDEFLKGLISTKVKVLIRREPNVAGKVTLYSQLFDKIDDLFGDKNFTAFIKKLEEIVLIKNKINPFLHLSYTEKELKNITKNNFFWGSDKDRRRIDYTITHVTDERILIDEEVYIATELKPYYTSTGSGNVPVFVGYQQEMKKKLVNQMDLGHFDLVSIHFYENPSFIDTTNPENTNYKNLDYLTFAGFVHYLKEKEKTKNILDFANNTLFAISLLIGLGELIAGLRGLLFLRAFVGAMIMTGDTAVYLTGNITFREYLKAKYPKDFESIIEVMMIAGTLTSLGGGAAVGTGALGRYSASEAGKFLATAESILKDVNATTKLTANEIKILKEGVERFENGLYNVRYSTEFIYVFKTTKGSLKFYKLESIRVELFKLTEARRLTFLHYNSDMNMSLVALLEKHPEVIAIWNEFDDIGHLDFRNQQSALINSVSARQFFLTKQYNKIGEIYGRDLVAAYEHLDFPGIRWMTDGLEVEHIAESIRIANDSSDIAIIADRFNIPVSIVERAKKHYWSSEHFTLNNNNGFEVGRFAKDQSSIDEWKKAINLSEELSSIEILTFKRIIVHEYIESKLIDLGMSYNSLTIKNSLSSVDIGAHQLSPVVGSGRMLPFNRLRQPPPVDYINYSNLDAIIDFYADFYRLRK